MENETNLALFFGDNPFIRILDTFIDNIGSEYSKKEVQLLAAISKGALFKHWHKLQELDLIRVTRAFGNTKLFTLNRKSLLVKDILRFEARMIEETMPSKANSLPLQRQVLVNARTTQRYAAANYSHSSPASKQVHSGCSGVKAIAIARTGNAFKKQLRT